MLIRANTWSKLDALCQKAIDKWGEETQVNKTIEECLELSLAITHLSRGRSSEEAVIEELADVYIMMYQILNYITPYKHFVFDDIVSKKLDKLEKRLAEEQKHG